MYMCTWKYYQLYLMSTLMTCRIRQEGASRNVDVSRDLVPLVASTSTVLDRVFPSEEHISEVGQDEQHTIPHTYLYMIASNIGDKQLFS